MTQQLVLKETGFYLQDSKLGWGWRGWKHSFSVPSSPMRPSISLTLHEPINKKHAQKFPMSLSAFKLSAQTGLHLWNVHSCVSELPFFHSSSLLQDLGYVVLSLPVIVQGSMCRVALGHGGVQGGTCLKRVSSLCVLQRSRSLYSWSQFSSKASPVSQCSIRQVLA